MTRRRCHLGAAVLAAVAGCSGEPTYTLSGSVTAGGKPVTWGTVTVIGSDNVPRSAAIRPDGTYSVAGLPPGPAKLAVTSPNPKAAVPTAEPPKNGARPPTGPRSFGEGGQLPPPPTTAPAAAGPWVPVPARYGNPDTSGLTTQVGPNSRLDIRAD